MLNTTLIPHSANRLLPTQPQNFTIDITRFSLLVTVAAFSLFSVQQNLTAQLLCTVTLAARGSRIFKSLHIQPKTLCSVLYGKLILISIQIIILNEEIFLTCPVPIGDQICRSTRARVENLQVRTLLDPSENSIPTLTNLSELLDRSNGC